MDALVDFKTTVDANGVPTGNWDDVRPYLALAHFTPEAIKLKNSAAAGLCSWTVNIITYYDIIVTVEPKKAKLRAATEELEEANEKLESVRVEVANLQLALADLTLKLEAATAEKAAAESEVASGQAKASLANRLTAALANENVRWAANVDKLRVASATLVGDTLLAAAFVSYAGPFTKRYRDDLVKGWAAFLETAYPGGKRMPLSEIPSPLAVLATEALVAEWAGQGLPDDPTSVQNAAIVTSTERYPLLIDPQGQGIAWVRELEGGRLVTLRFDQKDYLHRLETAIEHGHPVLIENCGVRLEATLDPILARATIKRGSRNVLRSGDREVCHYISSATHVA